MAVQDWAEMITVGRIVRPQHNRGEVLVVSETDFADERFAPGATLYRLGESGAEAVIVRESRQHDARWVVGFEGVGSIDAAEALRGQELRVPAESLMALGPGAYYVHDLIGCQVVTLSGDPVGTVVRVDHGAGIPLVVVEGADGEVLVPFAETFVRRVDLGGRRLEIDPPPGLIELNWLGRR